MSVSRSQGQAQGASTGRPEGTTDRRFLLHLRLEDDTCRPTLRDIEDGTLRTFARLSELVAFLEHVYDPQDSLADGQGTSAMHDEGDQR